jgi:splicing suppressor protein 51
MLNTAGVSNKSLLLNKLNLIALTDIATCPLTVLFSLQNSNVCLEEIKFLTIHLVGAEMQFEIDNIRKWELLLLHLIPSLIIMKVVFVGPELNIDNAFLQTVAKNKVCRKCHTAGRKVVYDFWKGLYHDFLKSEDYKKPDLISAFNAGLYRLSDFEGKDTWSPSIEAMLKEPDIPVVVTEYTEQEMPLDLQRIQSIVDSFEIIMSPAQNPFASSKPSLNFLSEEIVPVIFKNFYITILKRGKNVKKGENVQKSNVSFQYYGCR